MAELSSSVPAFDVPPRNSSLPGSSIGSHALLSAPGLETLHISPPERPPDTSLAANASPGPSELEHSPVSAPAHVALLDDDDADPLLTSPEAIEARQRLLNEQEVKAGYLLKKGEQRRTWKRRWFVLRSTRLAYYENEKEYQLLQTIDLRNVHTIAEAASQKEMMEWITAIKVARREIRRRYASHQPVLRSVSAPVSPGTAENTLPAFLSSSQLDTDVAPSQPPLGVSRSASSNSIGKDTSRAPRKVSFTEQPFRQALGALQSWGSAVGSSLSLAASSSSAPVSIPRQPQGLPVSPSSPSDALSLPSSPELGYRSYGPSSDEDPIGSDDDMRLSPSGPVPVPAPISDVPPLDDESEEIIVGPPLPGEDTDGVVYEGWLWKLGRSGNGWKRRWFVVRGGKVVAYKDEKEYQPLRLIPLSSVISILPAADQPPLQLSKSHPCALKIISPKRTWTLAADTSADFDRAVKALHAAHKGLHERRRAAEKAGAGDTGRNVEVQVTKVDGGKLVEINVSGVRS